MYDVARGGRTQGNTREEQTVAADLLTNYKAVCDRLQHLSDLQ